MSKRRRHRNRRNAKATTHLPISSCGEPFADIPVLDLGQYKSIDTTGLWTLEEVYAEVQRTLPKERGNQ